MDLHRLARYGTAMDVIDGTRMREAAIHTSHGTDPNYALPLDSEPRAAVEIYATRVRGLLVGFGAIALRASGVDALYRLATNTEFPV